MSISIIGEADKNGVVLIPKRNLKKGILISGVSFRNSIFTLDKSSLKNKKVSDWKIAIHIQKMS